MSLLTVICQLGGKVSHQWGQPKDSDAGSFTVAKEDLAKSTVAWAMGGKGMLSFGNRNETGLKKLVVFRSSAEMKTSSDKKFDNRQVKDLTTESSEIQGTTNKTQIVSTTLRRRTHIEVREKE